MHLVSTYPDRIEHVLIRNNYADGLKTQLAFQKAFEQDCIQGHVSATSPVHQNSASAIRPGSNRSSARSALTGLNIPIRSLVRNQASPAVKTPRSTFASEIRALWAQVQAWPRRSRHWWRK